ncbi:hypothetical protein IW262DRAFT_1237382, partial [Armillaria fumosa]
QSYHTHFHEWNRRDVAEMRKQAEAWRDATTCKARETIFKKYGVRWSEFWRLPYWDPTWMLVIDSMHCILEGLVHYHCRYVLAIDKEAAKKPCKPSPAFLYEWVLYDRTVLPEPINDLSEDQEKDISGIHRILELPLAGDGSITLDTLRKRLLTKSWASLMFVCATVGYGDLVDHTAATDVTELATDKVDFVDRLIQWVCTTHVTFGALLTTLLHQRLKWEGGETNSPRPRPVDLNALAYIQRVIKETVTPSWINSVPSKYGEDSAGSIKADEWRTLSTVFLPLALVTLWGDNDGKEPDPSSYLLQVLDHTMALFQA